MFCLGQILIQNKQYAEAEVQFKTLSEIPQYDHDSELLKLLAHCDVKLQKKKRSNC